MRGSMIARMVSLGGIALFTMGAQYSCSSGDGSLEPLNPDDSSLTVNLTLRKTTGEQSGTFRFGETIVFETEVTNNTGVVHEIQLPTGQVSDLVVLNAGGTQARWNQSFGLTYTQAFITVRIDPYRTSRATFQWSGILNDGTQIMPGNYEARAMYAYIQYMMRLREPNQLASPLRPFTVMN